MNKQRRVLITITYNEMGIIIDTKAEEVAQSDLQPTCNQLATDCINRSAALDVIRNIRAIAGSYDSEMLLIDKAEAQTELMMLPSAQPEQGCDECVFKPFKQFQPEQRWIPVSETVDVPEHEVLACDKYGTELIGFICEKDEQWMCESDTEIMYEVVAWMNKPEPYTQE